MEVLATSAARAAEHQVNRARPNGQVPPAPKARQQIGAKATILEAHSYGSSQSRHAAVIGHCARPGPANQRRGQRRVRRGMVSLPDGTTRAIQDVVGNLLAFRGQEQMLLVGRHTRQCT